MATLVNKIAQTSPTLLSYGLCRVSVVLPKLYYSSLFGANYLYSGQNQFSGVLIILTIGFEEFSSFMIFECPCDRRYNKLYGEIYMFVPAVLLFLFALLRQNLFWRLITGRCKERATWWRMVGTSVRFSPKHSKMSRYSVIWTVTDHVTAMDSGTGWKL